MTGFLVPRILIIAVRDDPHVKAVCWGLRRLGCEPVIWFWSDYPKHDSAALRIDPEGVTRCDLGIGSTHEGLPFDAVWVRRRADPSPMDGSHPDDADIVCTESNRFFDNILPRLGHAGTRWVNHPDADHKCRNKTTQLLAARSLGFRIPDTLIGNDIHAVREFFSSHPEGIIHKAFSPLFWRNEDGTRTSGRTSLITSAHLAREFAVRACPGIYQAKIEKKYELRVTMMGDTVFAAAIDSQRDGPTIDWRREGGRGETNLAGTAIAPELAERCRSLCRELGLAFGCIDLIVTPEDEIVFLEINCAGQFLFNELADPSMPMLDSFCRYLATGTTEGAATGRMSMAQFHDCLMREHGPAEANAA